MIKMNEDKKRRLLVKLEKEELINMIINEQAKLTSYRKSTERVIGDLKKDKIKLQNNWNELKKWLIQLQKFKGINQQGFSWGVAQEVLEKMQELVEEKDG